MSGQKSEVKVSAFERVYPLVAFFIFLAAAIFITHRCPVSIDEEAFANALSSTITWASVLLGFIGVLLGILFSLLNTELIQMLFKHATREVLKQYFSEALIGGILLIAVSMLLFIFNHQMLLSLWISAIIYKLLCSYRIISIMMHILFYQKNRGKNEDVVMPQNEREELYKKSNEKQKTD